jgi:hypothetical protein
MHEKSPPCEAFAHIQIAAEFPGPEYRGGLACSDRFTIRVRLKVSVRRGVRPHFFRGEGREVAEKGAGLTPAPSAPDTFNRPPMIQET